MEDKLKLYHSYFKIYQLDGRIENFHWMFINPDYVLDLINDLKGKVSDIVQIKEQLWEREDNRLKAVKIAVHADLNEPNDADGETLGWMEHYQL